MRTITCIIVVLPLLFGLLYIWSAASMATTSHVAPAASSITPPPAPLQPGPEAMLNNLRAAHTVSGSGFRQRGYHVWGGSVIRCPRDGLHHMYVSRWEERLGHNAWVTSSEVAHVTSPSPLGPWRFRGVALPRRGPQHWDGMATHNPTVHWDPRQRLYVLFYIGTTFAFAPPETAPFTNRSEYEARRQGECDARRAWCRRRSQLLPRGSLPLDARSLPLRVLPLTLRSPPPLQLAWNTKRVGVAVAASPHGPWQRLDAPILSPRRGHWDGGITSNPAAVIYPNGSTLVVYKVRSICGRCTRTSAHPPVATLAPTPSPAAQPAPSPLPPPWKREALEGVRLASAERCRLRSLTLPTSDVRRLPARLAQSIRIGYPDRSWLTPRPMFHLGAAFASSPQGPYTRWGDSPFLLGLTGRPLAAEDP